MDNWSQLTMVLNILKILMCTDVVTARVFITAILQNVLNINFSYDYF